ncbi:MAG: pilus assembly protein TadG-related protein [Syntrophomonas sp.]
MEMLYKLFKNESGQSTVLVALASVVLIGFLALAIDVGLLAYQKGVLQNAADAACLAGAQELPDDRVKADTVARTYASTNGNADDTVSVTIPADKRSINVHIERNVPLFFAKVLGISKSDLSADATACIGVAASVPWIVPFVIAKPASFNYDTVYVMRMYGGGPYPNGYSYPSDYKAKYPAYPLTNPYPYQFDYMNVKITPSSNPSREFQNYLTYLEKGYHETFTLNQKMLYYAPSSGGIPSVDTFQKRITADHNTDYTKARIGDPRVMLIPIVDKLLPRNTSENTKVTIIGFVGFYLQAVHKNSYYETFWFEGRFLKDLNIGSGEVTYDPNADFGLRVVNLTE